MITPQNLSFVGSIEATQGRLSFVHERGSEIGCLFVNCTCKRSICTMTKSCDVCQDGKNTSMLSGFIVQNDDVSVELMSHI